MNKKTYIKPEVQVEEFELVSMVATSIAVGETIEDGTTDVNNRRRGSWGDLWGGEE